MEKQRESYRQGDVLVIAAGRVPVGSSRLDHRVLATGETTGHQHEVREGEAVLFEKDGVLYLSVESETATLAHAEHAPLELHRGVWEIRRQRQYEPRGWRRVDD